MVRYLAQRPENVGRLFFCEQIDLQIEVISSLRLAIHRILTDENERRQQYRFEGEHRGKKREWKGIERPYREDIPKQPQQDKGGLKDHEIDRTDEPAYLVGNAVKRWTTFARRLFPASE